MVIFLFSKNKDNQKGWYLLRSVSPNLFCLQKVLPNSNKFEVDAATDPCDKSYLMYGSRIGLGDAAPHYQQLPLRAAIGKLSTSFAFKEKTQLLNNYLAERKLRDDAAKLLAKEMRQ